MPWQLRLLSVLTLECQRRAHWREVDWKISDSSRSRKDLAAELGLLSVREREREGQELGERLFPLPGRLIRFFFFFKGVSWMYYKNWVPDFQFGGVAFFFSQWPLKVLQPNISTRPKNHFPTINTKKNACKTAYRTTFDLQHDT